VAVQLRVKILRVSEELKVDGTALDLADMLHFEACAACAMRFRAFVKSEPYDGVDQRQHRVAQGKRHWSSGSRKAQSQHHTTPVPTQNLNTPLQHSDEVVVPFLPSLSPSQAYPIEQKNAGKHVVLIN
jgi:hypothetical protein